MILFSLMFVALVLTCVMFAMREMMLGFPSAIFWAITGGYAYTESTAIWDIYYYIFIASLLGMTIFCILAMYGLREKRDTIAEEAMGRGEGKFIDEESEKISKTDELFSIDSDAKPSRRVQELRKRAEDRRSGKLARR